MGDEMAKRSGAEERPERRWRILWGIFFYVVLAFATWGALFSGGHSGAQVTLLLVLTAIVGAWYGYWAVIRAGSSGDLAYLLGAAGVWATLSALDPDYLILGAAIFAPLCLHDRRWAGVGAVSWAEDGSGCCGPRKEASHGPR